MEFDTAEVVMESNEAQVMMVEMSKVSFAQAEVVLSTPALSLIPSPVPSDGPSTAMPSIVEVQFTPEISVVPSSMSVYTPTAEPQAERVPSAMPISSAEPSAESFPMEKSIPSNMPSAEPRGDSVPSTMPTPRDLPSAEPRAESLSSAVPSDSSGIVILNDEPTASSSKTKVPKVERQKEKKEKTTRR